ncbi:MAG: hypothetical protein ACLT0H_03365 [Lachnospiraceae bacterium]
MRKRIWFACLLAMSMTFAACGSKASTEVEQEDAATVQEDTPEAEEDTTQEEENTDTITPEESQEQTEEVQDPTVTETPEDEEAQKNDTAQDVTQVNAQYQVYAGTYYDMNIYEATAEGGESDSYCQIEVSNITDQTFDFAVYQLTDGNKQMILDTRTATFVEDGTKAVSEKDGTNLVFTFPDNWNALPKVVEMQVSGMDVLEGNSYVNNNVPGYEFG